MSKNSIDSNHDSSDFSMNLLNQNNSSTESTTAPTTTTTSSSTATTTTDTTDHTTTTTINSSDSSLSNPNCNDMVNKNTDHMLQQQNSSKKSSITESTSFLNVNNIKAHSENYCFLKAKKLERKYLKNNGGNSSNSNSNKNAISDNSLHPSDKYLNLYLDEKQQQLEGGAGGATSSGTSATSTSNATPASKNVIKSYPLFRSKDPPKNSDAGKFNYSFNSIGKRSRSSAASASSGSCTFCRQDSIESHNGGAASGYGGSSAIVAEYNRQHSAPTDTRPLSLTSSTSTTTTCTTSNTPGIINNNNSCYNSNTNNNSNNSSTTTTTAPAAATAASAPSTATPTASTTRLNSLKPASCLCFHTNSLKRKRLPSSTNRLSGGGGRYK